MTAKEWIKSQLGVWQFYYEGRDIGGCVMFESPDMRIWEEVALVNEQLMVKVNGFGPQPTRDDIASLHPAVAEALNH